MARGPIGSNRSNWLKTDPVSTSQQCFFRQTIAWVAHKLIFRKWVHYITKIPGNLRHSIDQKS